MSSGSVSEGGLLSSSSEPRGLTARVAWLKRPIMVEESKMSLLDGDQQQGSVQGEAYSISDK